MINLTNNNKRQLHIISKVYYTKLNKWLKEKKDKNGVGLHDSLKIGQSDEYKQIIDFFFDNLKKIILLPIPLINNVILTAANPYSNSKRNFLLLITQIKGEKDNIQKIKNKISYRKNKISSTAAYPLRQQHIAEKTQYENELNQRKGILNRLEQKVIASPYVLFRTNLIKLYEDFTGYAGYWLIDKLDIRICPYCNRQYTFKIDSTSQNGVKTRPQLDHFHPKSEHPIFALSFYNLIPSCPSCNHLKGEKNINIHPYKEGFNCKFRIEDKTKIVVDKNNLLLLKPSQFKITLNYSPEEEENIKVFGLKELYNQHKDYVREIMDKTQAYDSHAREALVKSFQGAGHTPEQVYDFVWGRYLNDADYEKKTLSKLTKDILEQLEIIR